MSLQKSFRTAGVIAITLILAACAAVQPKPPIDRGSADPGGTVSRGDARYKLLGTPLKVGSPLPPIRLVDAMTMKEVDLSEEKGSVLLLSLVPSVDTRVCELQTHLLGEGGDGFPPGIERITISRDTPFAQKRFAREAKLGRLRYLSDYKQGEFGRAAGLLVEGSMLLARSVIVADRKGIVRYLQVVPDLGHLPDMERAFEKAMEFAREAP
jgi:thioredoxin-dependent peroxiredoxin